MIISLKVLRSCKMSFRAFSFKNYDSIGFDLDHTIALYKLDNIIQLQYNLLVGYLVKNGYKSDLFSKNLTDGEVDFIQRGLFLDFKKGNILKISEDGTILRGTHGTKLMADKDLVSVYGENRKWDLTSKFVSDMVSTWGPPISDNMRSMMEFFDCQVPLVFGRLVDFVDSETSSELSSDYNVWPIVLDGIIAMFEPDGGFYEALKNNPELYLRKCSPQISSWMQNLRMENKLLFLLTGSRETESNFLADYCLGSDWKKHFDLIIYNAKKPGFFSQKRPFLEQNISFDRTFPLELTQGNWNELNGIISKMMSLENPKCVYIGDNIIQDVYATSLTSHIDAVALIEELSEEDNFRLQINVDHHPHFNYLISKFWGSYIFSNDIKTLTIWGSLIKKYSKLNIPSLDYLADKPVDYEFNSIWPGNC